VRVCTRRSGWDKRQLTAQLSIFVNGIVRVIPLIVFRGTEDHTLALTDGRRNYLIFGYWLNSIRKDMSTLRS